MPPISRTFRDRLHTKPCGVIADTQVDPTIRSRTCVGLLAEETSTMSCTLYATSLSEQPPFYSYGNEQFAAYKNRDRATRFVPLALLTDTGIDHRSMLN